MFCENINIDTTDLCVINAETGVLEILYHELSRRHKSHVHSALAPRVRLSPLVYIKTPKDPPHFTTTVRTPNRWQMKQFQQSATSKQR